MLPSEQSGMHRIGFRHNLDKPHRSRGTMQAVKEQNIQYINEYARTTYISPYCVREIHESN